MAKTKVTAAERQALIQVRDMLRNGTLEHKRNVDSLPGAVRDFFVLNLKRLFNMGVPATPSECGTVGCIGGWMGAMMGMTPDQAADFVDSCGADNKFEELFFPYSTIDTAKQLKCKYQNITTKQAAAAIDSFLKTGKPNWQKALAK